MHVCTKSVWKLLAYAQVSIELTMHIVIKVHIHVSKVKQHRKSNLLQYL